MYRRPFLLLFLIFSLGFGFEVVCVKMMVMQWKGDVFGLVYIGKRIRKRVRESK